MTRPPRPRGLTATLLVATLCIPSCAPSGEVPNSSGSGNIGDLIDLLDNETALTEARTRELAARRDLLLAQAALDLAVGRL